MTSCASSRRVRSRRRSAGGSPRSSRLRSDLPTRASRTTRTGGEDRDPAGIPPQGRRQHRCARDPLHPRDGRLAPPLRACRRHHRCYREDRDAAGHGQEGRGGEGRRRPDEEALRAQRRHVDRVRRERRRHHRQPAEPARDAHLRAGRPRAAREELHEDRLPGTRGPLEMAAAMKIKKGDLVQVLAGKDRGKQGRVIEARPSERRGHRREPQPRQAAPEAAPVRDTSRMGGTQMTPGGIIEKPSPLDVSNVMLVCPTCKQATRVGIHVKELKGETSRVRVCKRGLRQEIDR